MTLKELNKFAKAAQGITTGWPLDTWAIADDGAHFIYLCADENCEHGALGMLCQMLLDRKAEAEMMARNLARAMRDKESEAA